MEILRACGEASIMVMGMSFVIGSLTTIFILVILDLYRSLQTNESASDE